MKDGVKPAAACGVFLAGLELWNGVKVQCCSGYSGIGVMSFGHFPSIAGRLTMGISVAQGPSYLLPRLLEIPIVCLSCFVCTCKSSPEKDKLVDHRIQSSNLTLKKFRRGTAESFLFLDFQPENRAGSGCRTTQRMVGWKHPSASWDSWNSPCFVTPQNRMICTKYTSISGPEELWGID